MVWLVLICLSLFLCLYALFRYRSWHIISVYFDPQDFVQYASEQTQG